MSDGLQLRGMLPLVASDVLAGAVLRPSRLVWDSTRYRGPELRVADAASLEGLPGVVRLVIEQNFVGVVALDAAFANNALARLHVDWNEPAGARAAPTRPSSTSTPTGASGDSLSRTYQWPAVDDASTGVVAWHQGDAVTVWAACTSPEALRMELAALLMLPLERIEVTSVGSTASALAFDAAADAALLSRAVGRPVRVETQTHGNTGLVTFDLYAPRGARGRIARLEVKSNCASSSQRPSIARLLTQRTAGRPTLAEGPASYAFAQQHIAGPQEMGIGPTGLPANERLAGAVFASESFMDEAAREADADPVEFRLEHVKDPRGLGLLRNVREQLGGSQAHFGGSRGYAAGADGTRRGRGFAYAAVVDDGAQPPTRTWSAWTMDVAVDSDGHVSIERVLVGHDAESLRPMAGDITGIRGQVHDAATRLLQAPSFDDWPLSAPFDELPRAALPAVQIVEPSSTLAPTGSVAWHPAAALPAAAALANAIFDATGVRLRSPPFSGAGVHARLRDDSAKRPPKRIATWLGGLGAVAAALVASVLPWQGEIAPRQSIVAGLYSPATIERGRLVFAAGDCVVCHTAAGGVANAGGLALATPFGTVYSTNITPDLATGIGTWSLTAFERAMRDGVHRDGRRLYPAFPYTAYAKISDADIQALYAYVMAQPAVASRPPQTSLAFPFNVRGLLGGWNLLFHDNKPFQAEPARSAEWNRGAYLVQGTGHCGACHTPRNALGAERSGAASFLAGGLVDGWEAPALTELSKAPLPWTTDDLYVYLRTGMSARHGVAAGPMAPVIHGLGQLPDSDVHAIATYLSSLNAPVPTEAALRTQFQKLEAGSAANPGPDSAGRRIFEGACAACHASSGPTLSGSRVSLAVNTNLHSERADNLVQVILRGIQDPADDKLGYMPGFSDSLNDQQIEELVHYLRGRFGDGKAAWKDVRKTVKRIRDAHDRDGHPAH